jgi:DNA helicase-2/ATP-dependent DNA helicase PcrA
MARAEKALYVSSSRFRRRWGGGQPEPCIPSRFLAEIPKDLSEQIGKARSVPQVDLLAERHYVRESARKNLYTGKTYNSVENISQYFADRGMPPPAGIQQALTRQPAAPAGQQQQRPPAAQTASPVNRPAGSAGMKPPAAAAGAKKKFGPGSSVTHPKFGRGTVMKREGDGDEARLTINFPGYGLKKIIEKFAGMKE